MDNKISVSASFVRAWALKKGLTVGTRGHLPKPVVEAFNKAHKTKVFTNTNPWLAANKAAA